jgi:hypothetical protein
MALKLSITLPNGATGNYLRLTSVEWDRNLGSALGYLALYLNAAQAASAPAYPLGLVAQLNVRDDVFAQYLSNSALNGANDRLLAQMYAIAKNEPRCVKVLNGITLPDLAQAEDV